MVYLHQKIITEKKRSRNVIWAFCPQTEFSRDHWCFCIHTSHNWKSVWPDLLKHLQFVNTISFSSQPGTVINTLTTVNAPSPQLRTMRHVNLTPQTMSSPLTFCTSALTLLVMFSWWQYRAMRCMYASRSFLDCESGHCKRTNEQTNEWMFNVFFISNIFHKKGMLQSIKIIKIHTWIA